MDVATVDERAGKKMKLDVAAGDIFVVESYEETVEGDGDTPSVGKKKIQSIPETDDVPYGFEVDPVAVEDSDYEGVRPYSNKQLNNPQTKKDITEAIDHAITYHNNGKSEDEKVEFDQLVKANYFWSGCFLIQYLTFKVKGSSKLTESETLQAEVVINEMQHQIYWVERCRRKP